MDVNIEPYEMTRMKRLLPCLLACMAWVLLCCGMHAHAEIYKWRDEKGVMNYSDVPPPVTPSGQQIIRNRGAASAPTTLPSDVPLTRADAYPSKELTAADKKNAATSAAGNVSPEAEALKLMQAREKAQNCAAARTNYRNYAVGGRMQNVDEYGQKAFMTDEQIRDGLARAQQEIDEYCPVE